MAQDDKEKDKPQIQWHPAFVDAIKLELEEYEDILEFHPEFQLTSAPLKIDIVVIKKLKDVPIKKNIAAIFRSDNILEFKSPDDYQVVEEPGWFFNNLRRKRAKAHFLHLNLRKLLKN